MLIADKIIKIAVTVAIAITIACIGFFIYVKVFAPSNVQRLTPEEIKRPNLVADKLNVTDKAGKEIVKKIETAKPVQIVTVPAAHAPAEVKKIVETKPADKTAVVEEEKEIKVYKINLDKPRAIGLYANTTSVGIAATYKNVTVMYGEKYNSGNEVGIMWQYRW
jgi:hypothetical protein